MVSCLCVFLGLVAIVEMGNRIIFEASIDTKPFESAIEDMKVITNSFFDMADKRASSFLKIWVL